MTTDNRVLRWVDRQWLPALVAVVLGGIPLWGLVLDGAAPITIIEARAPEPVVPKGGALVLTYDIDRHDICPGEIQRIITDGQGVQHLIERYEILAAPLAFRKTPSLEEAQPAPDPRPIQLGRHMLTVSAPVPIGAAAGKARYQAIIHYYCNWVQRWFNQPVDVETPIVEFEINEQEVARPNPGMKLPNASPAPMPARPLIGPQRRSDLGPVIMLTRASDYPP